MKIILPIDFSDNSIIALDFAVALAGKKDGEIILIHVIEAVFDFASQASVAMESMHKDAETLMQKTLQKYQDSKLKFRTYIKEGTASLCILSIATEA
mgnify:FL=1